MTDLSVLHQHGLTHHQTGPLRTAGHHTAEAVADLVDAHRATAAASALSQIPGFGGRRIALVVDAVDSWRLGAGS
ncbi:hypothetical protein AB0J55_17585 [Amycolatopsis sp. NPDC049688]|uniref:hypothetical protein n=1 Tax=Amycolatopsis sp. NPDC049688 TaxID=3154733 RepID=UPI003442EC02